MRFARACLLCLLVTHKSVLPQPVLRLLTARLAFEISGYIGALMEAWIRAGELLFRKHTELPQGVTIVKT